MGKRKRGRQRREAPPRNAPRAAGGGSPTLTLATLGGVMALLIISFSNWRELDGIESSLSERLSRLETRIALSSDGPGSIPDRAAPPARRGPDPTRVYKIETDGAPARGPAAAAVTIAEFSDFQ